MDDGVRSDCSVTLRFNNCRFGLGFFPQRLFCLVRVGGELARGWIIIGRKKMEKSQWRIYSY